MRSKPHRPIACLCAALLCAGLGACNFGRNVSDDCWRDRTAFEAANRFRAGLRQRNLPVSAGAWAVADARIERSRKALRTCEDGASGLGRPDVEDLSSGHARGDATTAGGHGV